MLGQTGGIVACVWFGGLLQWRAEQLLGQTVHCPVQPLLRDPASMEGRAIARPNSAAQTGGRPKTRFNGGPLQWRAEQLLGQTLAHLLLSVQGQLALRVNMGSGVVRVPEPRPCWNR